VAWSVDILFIHILQNKHTQRAKEDLRLLEQIITFFQMYDNNYQKALPFRITEILHQIASKALAIPTSTKSRVLKKESIAHRNDQYESIQGGQLGQERHCTTASWVALSDEVVMSGMSPYNNPPRAEYAAKAESNIPMDLTSVPSAIHQEALPMVMDEAYMMNMMSDLPILDVEWQIPFELEPQYWQDPWLATGIPQEPFDY
jgi:hypothetical protein